MPRKKTKGLPVRISQGLLDFATLAQEWHAVKNTETFADKYRTTQETCEKLFGYRNDCAKARKERSHDVRRREIGSKNESWEKKIRETEDMRAKNLKLYEAEFREFPIEPVREAPTLPYPPR